MSPEAESDLSGLYEWIADRAGAGVAMDYIERIEVFCSGLDLASERGQARDGIRPGLRIVGFERRVVIAFALLDDTVVILRVFTGGQNWAGAFQLRSEMPLFHDRVEPE